MYVYVYVRISPYIMSERHDQTECCCTRACTYVSYSFHFEPVGHPQSILTYLVRIVFSLSLTM